MGESIRSQDLAEAFVQDEKHLHTMMYVESVDCFAVYQEGRGYFKLMRPKDFEETVYRYILSRVKKSISANLVKDIVTQIKWLMYLKRGSIESDYVALKDCLLDLNTFEYKLFDASRVTFYHIDVSSEQLKTNPTAPRFMQFLDEVIVYPGPEFKPDKDMQLVVQEMFGYCLMNTIEAHATFFLVGEGENGKSKLLDVLRSMIGDEFTSSMSIETLTTNKFRMAGLVGKKLNLCAEDESDYIKADMFKALVSGDPVEAEYKFGATFTYLPLAKHIFATNDFPKFKNLNHGLIRRIFILLFNRVIPPEMRDTKLSQKLVAEMPGILAWAIEGAKHLMANGFKFNPSEQMAKALEMLKENLSSAVAFVRDVYEEDQQSYISNDDLYLAYSAWCSSHGKKQQSYHNFLSDLNKVLKYESTIQWDKGSGRPKRGRWLALRKDEVIGRETGGRVLELQVGPGADEPGPRVPSIQEESPGEADSSEVSIASPERERSSIPGEGEGIQGGT